MSRNLNIWKVPDEICLKMRLLCVGQGISMAKLLTNLVEKAWIEDKTVVGKLQERKMKRVIKKW
jgi:hypothetical protein